MLLLYRIREIHENKKNITITQYTLILDFLEYTFCGFSLAASFEKVSPKLHAAVKVISSAMASCSIDGG